MMLTHLDLFSGIGGFALAARWAGFETAQFVELEPFAQKVLTKNFPGVPIHGDIKTFQAAKFRGCKLITGGYPCQPFSQAGKRRGEADDRHLWPEMFRVIREARPTWILCENVAGHITMGLDDVLFDLEDEGYACQTFVIPAVAKDARHRRDRVWVLSHAANARLEGHRRPEEAGVDRNEIPAKNIRSHRGAAGAAANADHDEVVNVCGEQLGGSEHAKSSNDSEDVAHSNSKRGCLWETNREDAEDVRESSRREEHRQWLPEPSVGRVAHGIPKRVDRLRGLGNAIVPQVAYEIMRLMK